MGVAYQGNIAARGAGLCLCMYLKMNSYFRSIDLKPTDWV